jgi:hypothetical protein
MQANAGDKWIQIGVNRWLAWIHKGVTYLNVVTVPEPAVDLSNLAVSGVVALDIEGVTYELRGELTKV